MKVFIRLTTFSGSGGSEDGDTNIDEHYWPPCQGTYTTLQQLEDRKGSIPAHCVEQYLVDVQVAVLDSALKKYKKLVDKGYDEKFRVYEDYVRDQIPDQINNFMASDKVDIYFQCKETKNILCCYDCRYANCLDSCVKGRDCKKGRGTIIMDKCPQMEFEVRTLDSTYIPNATFTLTDSEGFWSDIGEKWGIVESWVKFGKRHMRTNNGCQYAGKNVRECIETHDNFFHNYPLVDRDTVEIYNPKKVIGDSYPKAAGLLDRFKIVKQFGDWDELMQLSDLVDATSLPAFTTEEAVNEMDKIVEEAKEIEKRKREEFILSFLTGLLFWIPFVGELSGAAGLTAVRSLLRLIGNVGESGILVYDVVRDPQNAFMSVFGYLASAGVGRGGFRNAANSRRGLTSKEYDSLGEVKTRLDKVESIRGGICPI